jgi:hypothetical protein
MLLLHGDVPHTHAQELGQCILDKGPYKMIGTKTLDWVLDTLDAGHWLSFTSLPKGAVLWDDLEALLRRMDLGYAVVLDQDFHGNGDIEVSVLCAHDPTLGDARFLYGSSMPNRDAQGLVTRPNGRLLLSVDATTPAVLDEARIWQAWLDGLKVRVARSAHASLEMYHAST